MCWEGTGDPVGRGSFWKSCVAICEAVTRVATFSGMLRHDRNALTVSMNGTAGFGCHQNKGSNKQTHRNEWLRINYVFICLWMIHTFGEWLRVSPFEQYEYDLNQQYIISIFFTTLFLYLPLSQWIEQKCHMNARYFNVT